MPSLRKPFELQPPLFYPWLHSPEYEWRGTHNGTKQHLKADRTVGQKPNKEPTHGNL